MVYKLIIEILCLKAICKLPIWVWKAVCILQMWVLCLKSAYILKVKVLYLVVALDREKY